MNSNNKPSWKAVQKAWQSEQREFEKSRELSASSEVVGRALYKIRLQSSAGSIKEQHLISPYHGSFFQLRDWAWGTCASIVLSIVVALPLTAMHPEANQRATVNSDTVNSDAFVSELLADSVMEVTLE